MSQSNAFEFCRRWTLALFGTLIITFMVSTAGVMPARALFAETAAAGLLINHFGNVANDLIDKGRDSGDFLLWRLGIQLQGVIDAWKKANSSLLNEGFDKLDRASQDLFRKLESEIETVRNEKDITVDQVERLTGEWSAIISQTAIGSGDPSVLNTTPRVIVPDGGSIIPLAVTGTNLPAADATIDIGSRHDDKPIVPSAQQIQFSVMRSELAFPEDESTSLTMPLSYRTQPTKWYKPWTWFSRARSRNDLSVVLLPKRLAKYEIRTRVLTDVKLTDTRTINLGQFRGRNSRVPRAVAAPDAALGWHLDLTRRQDIHLLPGGGDHGRCEGIEDASITENGLTMFARVDNRDNWLGTHDAWVDCSISLPVYRMETREEDGPTRTGELSWNRDETFELPPNLRSVHVDVTTFDRRSRVFTGAGSDRFFDVKSEGRSLIFRPRPPRDL
ncbi:hypothetical protein ACVWZZ_004292 [Bradyrhizobium sp. LM6.10]